jgi:glycosyltransferase involved in cell wall biosynthesis
MRQGEVVALVPAPSGEPGEYLTLLHDALVRAGVRCAPAPALTTGWAHRRAGDIGVLHLHWLEFIAPSDRSRFVGAAKTARRAARLCWALRTLQRRGVAVVWTVHNLAPHEPLHPRIECQLQRTVLRIADAAIVHSEHARARVASRLGHPQKLHSIPHGNYLGAYPPATRTASVLRKALGLKPDAFVYLSFGQVRAYKRLPELLDAFRSLPDENVALLIAGEPRDPREEARVRERAAQDPRVVLDLRRIPVEEVAEIHRAADAAVFAYDGMFSSGSVLLALSQGLPVIVPADSTGTELAPSPAIEPIGAGGVPAALRGVRRGDQRVRRNAALAAAARHDWTAVGDQTARVYELAGQHRARRLHTGGAAS